MRNWDDTFEEHLDSGDNRRSSAAADPQRWTSELALQSHIDASLRRLFSPTAGDEPAFQAARNSSHISGRLERFSALAAALALYAGAAAWVAFGTTDTSGLEQVVADNGSARATWSRDYEEACLVIQAPPNCNELGETSSPLILSNRALASNFGPTLSIDSLSEDFVLIGPYTEQGFGPANFVEPNFVTILGRCGDSDVMVKAFESTSAPDPEFESVGELNLFRRELGGFVLYELSPLPAPCLLPSFRTTGRD